MTKTAEDPYAAAVKSKLNLKCDQSTKKKKQKSKAKKDIQHNLQIIGKVQKPEQESVHREVTKTKAELAFFRQREKVEKQRILEKASKTHKQRVQNFNQHLDQMSEHFEMAKVSWTK